jgi:hypothetical protein
MMQTDGVVKDSMCECVVPGLAERAMLKRSIFIFFATARDCAYYPQNGLSSWTSSAWIGLLSGSSRGYRQPWFLNRALTKLIADNSTANVLHLALRIDYAPPTAPNHVLSTSNTIYLP